MHNAFELYGSLADLGPMVVTCEHASNRVPAPLRSTSADRIWLAKHWGWDIGARTVAREVVRCSRSVGVFSRFSRLVCDANREPGEDTFIRTSVEGHPLSFNQRVDPQELARRVATLHEPYHRAVDALIEQRLALGGDLVLLSIHSFTPVLGDEVRAMELGVLFDPYEAIAERLASELQGEGFVTALNEPYSGKENMLYAVHRHGTQHGLIYLELEVRQDLIGTAARARAVGHRVANALSRLHVRGLRRG